MKMTRRGRLCAAALTVLLAAGLLFALPAEAKPNTDGGSSFAWSFEGKRGIQSPKFSTTTTNDLWVTSWSDVCSVRGSYYMYSIKLYKKHKWTGYRQVGKPRYVVCGGEFVWPKVAAGKFYFDLYVSFPFHNKVSTTISGGVYFDGATP